jgi:hypothetical protein
MIKTRKQSIDPDFEAKKNRVSSSTTSPRGRPNRRGIRPLPRLPAKLLRRSSPVRVNGHNVGEAATRFIEIAFMLQRAYGPQPHAHALERPGSLHCGPEFLFGL